MSCDIVGIAEAENVAIPIDVDEVQDEKEDVDIQPPPAKKPKRTAGKNKGLCLVSISVCHEVPIEWPDPLKIWMLADQGTYSDTLCGIYIYARRGTKKLNKVRRYACGKCDFLTNRRKTPICHLRLKLRDEMEREVIEVDEMENEMEWEVIEMKSESEEERERQVENVPES